MSIVSTQKRILDTKECFMLWFELGTLRSVSEHLALQGIINQKTGLPVTIMAVWVAALTWVIHNSEEARKYYIELGSTQTNDEWEEYIVRKAMTIYSSRRKDVFLRWTKKIPFAKNYEHLYARKYGLDT